MRCTLFLTALLSAGMLQAQCGMTGDTLEVNDTDALAALATCTSIQGSLLISEPAISNVSALENLVSVEEHLLFHDNISLLDISHLAALETVGGNFEFINNFTLQTLNGLENLQSIGGHFELGGNITLIHFDALQGCSLAGDVLIHENHTLETVNGLSGITAIAGTVLLDGENLILDDLSGLSAVQSIEGNLEISLPDLTQLADLHSLETVGGNLYVHHMPLLANFNGMEAMQSVADTIHIAYNNSLVNIESLAGLDVIGAVDIQHNPALMWCCTVANWELNNAVQGTAVLENNHSNCTGYSEVVESCEPLSIARSKGGDFVPGLNTVREYTLTGSLVGTRVRWLNHPDDVLKMARSGVHILHVQPMSGAEGWYVVAGH